MVTIDGRTLSAESEGMPVEEGQPVRVIQVRGACLVVRPVEEERLPADPLQQTYEDPFDEGGGERTEREARDLKTAERA